MNETVSSSKGRSWLNSLTPAVTAYETAKVAVSEFPSVESLSQKPIAKSVEVQLPSRNKFQTEAVYRQLLGIGTPTVSDLAQLIIPDTSVPQSQEHRHDVVFVDIPNLGTDPLADTNLKNLAAVSGRTPATPQNESYDPSAGVIKTPRTAELQTPSVVGASTDPISNHQPTTEMNTRSPEKTAALQSSKLAGGEIGILAEKILDRFPLASPTILLFVGGEPDPNVESTCKQVADALARCHVGNVLLVDGNLQHRQLSIFEGMAKQSGLSEAINRDQDWRPLVAPQGSGAFSFLPAGVCPPDRWNANELLRRISAEMKQDFQFICVAAGDAHSKQAKLWCDVCDGSYLVVSLRNSNETFCKSAIEELTNQGARVLGCVVADAE